MSMFGAVSAYKSPPPPPTPPTVNISSPSPSSGVAGTVVIDYTVTYNGADAYNLALGEINTTGTTASGTWSIINGGTSSATVRFTTTAGDGGICKFKVLAGACQNQGVDNVESSFSSNGTSTATPPVVSIGSPSPAEDEEGTAIINWGLTYTYADTYNLSVGEITANYTGSTAGTWSIINGSTATPTVRFTSTTGFGTVGFDVLAGACQNGGVNNTPSSPSPTATITEDTGK